METKKKSNHVAYGVGHVSPNTRRVTVYLHNPSRKDSLTGKGSNTFKTTHIFKDIDTLCDALEIIDSFSESRKDGHVSLSAINKAYYNGKLIVSNGVLLTDAFDVHKCIDGYTSL